MQNDNKELQMQKHFIISLFVIEKSLKHESSVRTFAIGEGSLYGWSLV